MRKYGLIYVMHQIGTDYYKVGFTSKDDANKSRLPQAKTHNPQKVRVIHQFLGSLEEEQELHEYLAPFKSPSNNEWYELQIGPLLQAILISKNQLKAVEHSLPYTCPEVGQEVVIFRGNMEGITAFFAEEVLALSLDEASPGFQDNLITGIDLVAGQSGIMMASIIVPATGEHLTVPISYISAL